ncbi:VanZ family protein [Pseudoflavonifractor sp. 60]|uniref:VanZ family protein n=1 Tax=Pseudoflavonifractor sp. 60 TaxID=2304576 RepID=UPI001368288B|nr:VanZ family protein [Pseudoflavonifractor sp. 60]NBI65258.1 VanZ family protein [Pseudoflavonifractor sp. 60]
MSLTKTLWWYLENIWDYLLQMLPCMCIALVVFLLLRPRRFRRLARLGLNSGPLREGGLLLFVMFSAGLAALTVFPAYFWTRGHWMGVWKGTQPVFPPVDFQMQLQNLQLEPFQEIFRAVHGPWVMFLVLANIGIFSPVGFFTALLWRNPRWWKSLLAGFCSSVTIEFVQFFIGRSTDIDDVILNTTGALAGFWIFCLLRAAFPSFTEKFQCQPKGGYFHG